MKREGGLLVWCEHAPLDQQHAAELWKHLRPSLPGFGLREAQQLTDAQVILLVVSANLHDHLSHNRRREQLNNQRRSGALLLQIKVTRVTDDMLLDPSLKTLPAQGNCVYEQGSDPSASWVAIVQALPKALEPYRQPVPSLGDPLPPEPNKRAELYVSLHRSGTTVQIQYHDGRRNLGEGVSRDLPRHLPGADLFDLLFPNEALWTEALRTVWRLDRAVSVTPALYPLRLRLWTEDPELATLPWHTLTRELALCGSLSHWTCEISPQGPARTGADKTLLMPCPVLVFAPGSQEEDPGGVDSLLAALLPRGTARRCRVLRDPDGLFAALSEPTGILYVLGSGDGTGLSCGPLRLPWKDFVGAVQAESPLIVYMEVAGAPPRLALQLGVPLSIVCRGGEDPDLFARFVTALLRTRRAPVAALYQEALPAGSEEAPAVPLVCSRGNVLVYAPALPPPDDFMPWRLDRTPSRAMLARHIDELIRSRRVEAIVSYAAPGNHLERFVEQALDEVLDNGALHMRVTLPLPTPAGVPKGGDEAAQEALRDQAFDLMRLHLGHRGDEDHAALLRQPRIPLADTGPTVLWLDCGVHRRFDEPHLAGFLAFCQDLAAPGVCPDGLRVVAYLALERSEDQHEALSDLLKDFRDELEDERFNVSALPPLRKVEAGDLRRYLYDHTQVPRDLVREVAQLIMRVTEGHYEETVAILKRARERGWDEVRKALSLKAARIRRRDPR